VLAVRLLFNSSTFTGLILALLAFPADLASLSANKSLTQYTQTVWTQAQGLPQDTIRAIAQTQDGYLWLGTDEGLVRFDGYEFVTYTKADGSLPSDDVIALTVGRSGTLWIGTSDGLSRYSNRQFKNFTVKDGLPGRGINSLVEDQAGVLWMASGGFLCQFEDGRFKTYPKQSLAPIETVHVVYEDVQQQLWVGGAGGVVKRVGDRFSVVLGSNDLRGDFINAILRDSVGLWVAGYKGIVLVRPDGGVKRFDISDGLPDNLVRALCEDRAGNVWAGTNGGLSRIENGRFVSSLPDKKDGSDWIWSLFEDREGDLWVGMNSALSRFRDDPFLVYGRAEGLPSEQPTVVHQDARGEIWVGYHDGGLLALNRRKVFTTRDGLASNEIFAIRQSRNRDLLIGTRRGLSRMHDGRFLNYPYPPPNPLGPRIVYDVLEDSSGHLWIASVHGVHEWDRTHWRAAIEIKARIPTSYPVALAEGRDGSIWAGTLGAVLWLVRDGRNPAAGARVYATADQIGNGQVRSLYPDSDGTLWIGTFGGGLSALRDGVFHRWGMRDGLLSNNISHVEDDHKGNLWLSTTRGICRISKQQLRDFSAGKIHVLTPRNYGIEDGLRSAQCAPGFPAGGGGTRTRDGHLWFPTSRGLAIIDPNAVTLKTVPTPISRITEVSADGRVLDFSGIPRLKPSTGRVEFRFTGIDLSTPELVRYSTRLEGLDSAWIPADHRRVVTYNHLPHGHYQFLVQAGLPGGSKSESQFAFEVLPHFYETEWFYLLCAASVLAGIYSIYQLRLRQINRGFALVLEERGRLAREIHDTLAQGFVGISSQLDALAIKLDGDPAVARQNLDLARKMARYSLTEARRSVMDLRTSELEQQDLPAALETSARHWVAGSSVDVRVDVSGVSQKIPEDLEQNLLRIAQEAVANALKHARARIIWVELEAEDCALRLRVKDDGRGFEPSGAFSITAGHFGILGMQERAKRVGGKFDLTSSPGSGTQVEVRVPFATGNGRGH
jgi:signal transduction histidine kinase/ligand-binding sensor domain-containing protein